jgi:hypothetical protein
MGALAPLYLAGLAALSLPVIFHLVRRTPRDRQVFSSLMFLSPSPPRLTRKSRLDQILLLFLRLAALALLAAAFARPFLRETSLFAMKDLPMRRVAILLDVSASMQRGEVWRAAIERMERELNDLGPQDEAALFTFSDQVRTLVRFPSEQAGRSEQDSATAIRTVLADLKPGWGGTDLGAAVSMIAAEIAADADAKQSVAETQILVLSDFQKSASLTSLQAFEWPAFTSRRISVRRARRRMRHCSSCRSIRMTPPPTRACGFRTPLIRPAISFLSAGRRNLIALKERGKFRSMFPRDRAE